MWKVSEDAMLYAGVKKYGRFAWEAVSASMFEHSRSWRECKERYEILTEPKLWTSEEDALLKTEVEKFHSFVLWATVASVMRRPLQSCRRRYLSLTKPDTIPPTRGLDKVKAGSKKIQKSAGSAGARQKMKRKIQL
ncbi:hypothetical protein Bca52824_066087 [Brassica carinata]|uniref:Uncharacterized protein n=1 Tax=Brassica carinata TaxID=52824 RepID=A0A8X7UA94_BRACI|nr:PREDICTED: pre-mRNA-splicing factor CEF1-like [Brassica oleracea var. oleracea]KAG2271532.1 hypothetical protein Bca52824_066087 [Brassica carinata]